MDSTDFLSLSGCDVSPFMSVGLFIRFFIVEFQAAMPLNGIKVERKKEDKIQSIAVCGLSKNYVRTCMKLTIASNTVNVYIIEDKNLLFVIHGKNDFF